MRYVVKRKWVIMALLDLFLLLPAIYYPELSRITLILLVWGNGLVYAFDDLSNRSAILAFLISFFTFLIGRQAFERFHIYEVEHVFSEELNQLAENLVLISLFVMLLTYIIVRSINYITPKVNKRIDYNSQNYVMIRKVSRFFFFVTFTFNLFNVMDIVLFVLRHGYLSFYTSYSSSVPYAIKKIGEMSPVCYWIYLSTMPEKKSTNQLTLYYAFYLLITLGTGKRFPFVAGLLTIFVYYYSRNNINNPNNEVWFGKKHMRVILVAVPVGMLLLFIVGQIRFTFDAGEMKIGSFITDFIYDQGSSINVIKRMVKFGDYLPKGKKYLFGSSYEVITGNVIFRLMGARQFTGNNAVHALQGYSMQHALSYITMGSYYIKGHGIGSAYMAEAFHDYGYLGVVLVNIVYGFIFGKVFDFKNRGIWSCTITLIMLYSLLLAPRGSADGFICDIVDLTTWGTIIVVWLTSKLLLSRQNMRTASAARRTAGGLV